MKEAMLEYDEQVIILRCYMITGGAHGTAIS